MTKYITRWSRIDANRFPGLNDKYALNVFKEWVKSLPRETDFLQVKTTCYLRPEGGRTTRLIRGQIVVVRHDGEITSMSPVHFKQFYIKEDDAA